MTSSPPAQRLQGICQSKHSCKCYGKMGCVALSPKENTIIPSNALSPRALYTYTLVISVGLVVFAAFCSSSGVIRCTVLLWRERERESVSGAARRGRCRWCSCNSAVINGHRTWLMVTRVNTAIAKVNT